MNVNLRDCYRVLPPEIILRYEEDVARRCMRLLPSPDSHKKSAPPASLRAGLKKRAKQFS